MGACPYSCRSTQTERHGGMKGEESGTWRARRTSSQHLSMFGRDLSPVFARLLCPCPHPLWILSSFSARDIFAALGRLPGAPQSAEGVAQFLSANPPAPSPTASPYPSSSAQKPRQRQRRIVLIVHNIDVPKVHALLNPLVLLSGVQIAASVDLWTSMELLACRWPRHDLTTVHWHLPSSSSP